MVQQARKVKYMYMQIILDYTRGNKSIWDYISQCEGISDKKQIFEYLAAAGIKTYFKDK